MTGRRAIVGLCMLCALLVSAVAAQGAAAATNGTTAFTCQATASGAQFSDAHCKTAKAGGEGFKHVEVPPGTVTEIEGTSAKTNPGTTEAEPTLLKSVVSGIETELKSTLVTGTGTMENMKDAVTGEHTASGTGSLVYTGVTVTKPAGKGCVVKTGEVKTKALKATTAGIPKVVEKVKEGEKEVEITQVEAGMGLKFEPAAGTVFATFEIEGCTIAALNGLYEVKGTVIGVPEGATTVFTHTSTTAQGTLTLRGQKAGIEGKLTISGRANSSQSYTPLTTTTVATP